MSEAPSNAAALDAGDPLALGAMLAPVVREAAGPGLGEIEWFRTSWQRGGSATGNATWTHADGSHSPCVVKVPVGPDERRWVSALGDCGADGWSSSASLAKPTPRLLASAEVLGPYDMCWLVTERFEGKPVSAELGERPLAELLDAAASFQARAARIRPPAGRPWDPDWEKLIGHARAMAREDTFDHARQWHVALKHAHRLVPRCLDLWLRRPTSAWLHGDLHPANAMWRANDDGVRHVALIDLALVRPGHWSEDALYLERQFWGRRDRLHGVRPLSYMARARREAGLPIEDEYGKLANAKRLLAAAAAPANLDHEGDATYLAGALDVLERTVRTLGG
ncbi:MAG: aminoglycoside phosphotransferase family protein [Planctomycetota bacterium]